MNTSLISRKLLSLAATLLLLWPGVSPAATAGGLGLGVAQALVGQVFVNEMPLVPATTLFAGDRIKTGEDGRVFVQFFGHGQVAIDSLTEITLDPSDSGLGLRLIRGRLVVQQSVGGRIHLEAGGSKVHLASTSSGPALCEVFLRAALPSVTCAQGEARLWRASKGEPLVVPAGFRAVSRTSANQGAPADQHAGRVTAVVPQSQIERGTTQMETVTNSDLLWADLVRTERRGRVRIGLDDGSVLNVGSDSQLRVLKHEATTQYSELEMKVGRMLVDVRKLGPQGKFELRTSTAVLGVIGTRFFVEATPTSTRVIVFEGIVQIANILATIVGQTQVSVGQQAMVAANQAPSAASPASPASMQAATSQTQVGAGAGGAAGAVSNVWVLVPAAAAGVVTAVIVPTVIDDEPVSPSSPSSGR